ncbi:hypothetical protein C8R46DRAFT_875283, partial [Mycena filopes]
KKRTAKSAQSTGKTGVYERRGCLSKSGVCKARFPRDVFPTSEIDPDGHVNIKKTEANMNTFTPVMTYFSRSNTDVTSLLSGTAVKAVISYVSDYVSKMGMKTYQAFASVFEVFDRNSEQVSEENVEGTVKAKNLMRQMINSMSTKLEIGSPMASMYVLGNPDHYSSHKFVNFWWRTYVTFIKRHWAELEENPMDNDDENPHEERITIKNQNGTFVALSPVDDYRYRPIAYESVNLYEWIQCSDKKSRNKKEREQYFEHLNFKKDLQTSGSDDGADGSDASDDESELDDFIVHDGNSDTSSSEEEDFDSDDDSDWSLNDEDDVILRKEKVKNRNKRIVRHAFLLGHPQMHTHGVHCDFTRLDSMIPNFLGGAIPRADKGDREYYCMTIMTLFKPWRTPSDLKDVFSTWDQTFLDHTFTSRQVQLISNFNIRYECNDARDDHFALMKKK